ncbi:hypothetical protein TrVE_jg1985 [Triparma verrucosa]|uniref:Protein kinase domain-containing protein n=1 Tax=Triparma verrucosa TaxID=1606542 RepID=A0A9W7BVT1_9STRA|nr:hypothetical protein TrVE_jg1985 [Triparma verrucosa]
MKVNFRYLALALLLNFPDQVTADSYLLGGTDPVCWRTQQGSGGPYDAVELDPCPTGTTIAFDTAKPTGVIEGDPITVAYSLTVDTTVLPDHTGTADTQTVILYGTSSNHVPHANIHSCLASVGTCTPFVANTPTLSTHSSALKADFDSTTGTLTETLTSTFYLDAAGYTMIAHGRFYTEDSNGIEYKWDVANGYSGVNVADDDYMTDSYLMGGNKPICWRTKYVDGTQDGDKREMSCPTGTTITLDTEKPETLADGEAITMEYTLTVNPSSLTPTLGNTELVLNGGNHIPHANIHSCVSGTDEGPCTPFISNTPGLATHSSALKSNFTASGTVYTESFASEVSLTADSYTMIAHGRWYVGESGTTTTYKWDIANGYGGVVVSNVIVADGKAKNLQKILFIIIPLFVLIAIVCLLKLRKVNKKVEFLKEEVKKRQWTPEEMMLIKQVMENRNKETDTELQSVLLNASEIILTEKIGRGAFGEVHRGTHRGTAVAVKTLLEVDSTSVERFRAEILLMKDLKHPYIVLLIGAAWSSELIGMVMEYMSKGAMSNSLQAQETTPLSWKDVKLNWAKNVIAGLKYLHNSKFYDESKKMMQECIIHRDLKPDNILIADNMSAKLSDFGESRAVMNDAQQTMTAVGTTFYVAPEIMLGEKYGSSADIFSYAVTLAAMSYINTKGSKLLNLFSTAWEQSDLNKGGFPTQHAVTDAVISKDLRPQLGENLPQSLKDLVNDCWKREPNSRPSVDEIIKRLDGQITTDINAGSV